MPPADPLNAAKVQAQFDRFVEELRHLISIRSVSSDEDRKPDTQEAADWIASRLREIPVDHVEVFSTIGNPVVYGELTSGRPEAPTIMIYGHYDVQSAEPLEDWNSDPYEALIEGDYMFGRGSSDMKGQLLACITAVQAIVDHGPMGVNLKFLIEGNEEHSPDALVEFLPEHREMLQSDFSLNCDAGMLGSDKPTIVYGLRGNSINMVRIWGPKADIHDGMFGGVIDNPIHVLSRLIAGFHDQDGKILIPGFYDKVRQLGEDERAELARIPLNESDYLKTAGAPAIWGESQFLPVERIGARPSLNVRLFQAGRHKSAIPNMAQARVSKRLVPDQDPHEAHDQLVQFVKENAPNTVKWEVEYQDGWLPSLVDRETPGIESLKAALEAVWGVQPYFTRIGGGIPAVGWLQEILGIESVLTGFSLPDDSIHGPNERVHLPTLEMGIQALIRFFQTMASVGSG